MQHKRPVRTILIGDSARDWLPWAQAKLRILHVLTSHGKKVYHPDDGVEITIHWIVNEDTIIIKTDGCSVYMESGVVAPISYAAFNIDSYKPAYLYRTDYVNDTLRPLGYRNNFAPENEGDEGDGEDQGPSFDGAESRAVGCRDDEDRVCEKIASTIYSTETLFDPTCKMCEGNTVYLRKLARRAPVGHTSGGLRQYVQALYGTTRNDLLQYGTSGLPWTGAGVWPIISDELCLFRHNYYEYYLIHLHERTGTVSYRKLMRTGCGDTIREYLLDGAFTGDNEKILESYLLSTLKQIPDYQANTDPDLAEFRKTIIYTPPANTGSWYSEYGFEHNGRWHFNWDGTEARSVRRTITDGTGCDPVSDPFAWTYSEIKFEFFKQSPLAEKDIRASFSVLSQEENVRAPNSLNVAGFHFGTWDVCKHRWLPDECANPGSVSWEGTVPIAVFYDYANDQFRNVTMSIQIGATPPATNSCGGSAQYYGLIDNTTCFFNDYSDFVTLPTGSCGNPPNSRYACRLFNSSGANYYSFAITGGKRVRYRSQTADSGGCASYGGDRVGVCDNHPGCDISTADLDYEPGETPGTDPGTYRFGCSGSFTTPDIVSGDCPANHRSFQPCKSGGLWTGSSANFSGWSQSGELLAYFPPGDLDAVYLGEYHSQTSTCSGGTIWTAPDLSAGVCINCGGKYGPPDTPETPNVGGPVSYGFQQLYPGFACSPCACGDYVLQSRSGCLNNTITYGGGTLNDQILEIWYNRDDQSTKVHKGKSKVDECGLSGSTYSGIEYPDTVSDTMGALGAALTDFLTNPNDTPPGWYSDGDLTQSPGGDGSLYGSWRGYFLNEAVANKCSMLPHWAFRSAYGETWLAETGSDGCSNANVNGCLWVWDGFDYARVPKFGFNYVGAT